MKVVLFVILASCVSIGLVESQSMFSIMACAIRQGVNIFGCAASEMRNQYQAMVSANCKKCDKYFHCQANFNAVQNCGSGAEEDAEIISDCREGDSTSADSLEDQIANRYGRRGYNCAARYLCSYGCKWSPSRQTCSRSNC